MMLRGRNVCGSCVALACGTPRPNNTRRNRNEKLGGEAFVWMCVWWDRGGVCVFFHFRAARSVPQEDGDGPFRGCFVLERV